MALPLLDAMVPAQTPLAQTAAVSKPRLTCIEIVHGAAGSTVEGWNKHYWSPDKTGSDFEFTQTLKPLEPFRDYLTIVSNTDLIPANAHSPKEEGADHFRSSSTYLTAAHVKMTEGADIECGTSIDQIYAQHFGQDTPLPSLQLCIESLDGSGACDYGYSLRVCRHHQLVVAHHTAAHGHSIRAWLSNRFSAMAARPRNGRRASRSAGASSTGFRTASANCRKVWARATVARLNAYLDDVREIERRIQRIEKYNSSGEARALPSAPIGVPDSYDEHVKLMFDLQALAFMTNTTRVSAFKMSRDVNQRVYPESGVKTPFHSLSHHGETPSRIAEFAKINLYHAAPGPPYFLEKLRSTPDGDGNLLDHSLILYGSPIGDSNAHNHKRLPVFLAGKANGALKGNLHVRTPDGTPFANVLLTMMHKLGVDIETIGDSNGVISI